MANIENLPAHFPKIFEDVRRARENFPRDGSTQISHENNTPIPSHTYLLEAGVPEDTVYSLFAENGAFIFPPIEKDPYTMSPEEAISEIIPPLTPVYEVAQASLANVNWFGYNVHDATHIEQVSRDTIDLLRMGGFSVSIQLRGALAGIGHDLFNLFNRDVHSYGAVYMYPQILPKILNNPEYWFVIRNAIILHNEPAKKALTDHLNGSNAKERVEFLKTIYTPEAFALWIADKTAHGRGRINSKAISRKAFDEHKYSAINMIMETDRLELKDNKFYWRVRFNPIIKPDELSRFSALSTGDESSMTYVPESLRKDPIDESSPPSFEKSLNEFWRINRGRTSGLVEASFGLFDGLEEVHIIVEGDDGMRKDQVLNLDSLDDVINNGLK